MVQELSKLHDHVREPGVGDVVVGVILLAAPPGTGKARGVATPTGNVAAVLVTVRKQSGTRLTWFSISFICAQFGKNSLEIDLHSSLPEECGTC